MCLQKTHRLILSSASFLLFNVCCLLVRREATQALAFGQAFGSHTGRAYTGAKEKPACSGLLNECQKAFDANFVNLALPALSKKKKISRGRYIFFQICNCQLSCHDVHVSLSDGVGGGHAALVFSGWGWCLSGPEWLSCWFAHRSEASFVWVWRISTPEDGLVYFYNLRRGGMPIATLGAT